MTLFDGITARIVETPRLAVGILEREGDDPATSPEQTVVLIHGNVSSSLFWQEIMQDLPSDLRVIAIDLRGFGATEHAPVDATRGVRDFSDDVFATLEVLGIPTAHLVGWSMGGGVVMQYALDHPALSLTLQAPVSPYGFGGTRRDGTRLTDDDAGTRRRRREPGLRRSVSPTTTRPTRRRPRRAASSARATSRPATRPSTRTCGSSRCSRPRRPRATIRATAARATNWPGFAPGDIGVLNTMAPAHFDVSGIVRLEVKPPILWIHGTADAIVSDASFYDLNHLGQLGIIPGWPGAEIAPAQEMVSQTRDVLEAYAAAGGDVVEVSLEGVGHSPHLERPAEFRHALLTRIGYVGAPADPAPATEAIILRSAD